MVVAPVDAEKDEAQHVHQKRRQDRPERLDAGAVRHLQLEHHDRDEDRDHAVAERLESTFAHVSASSSEDGGRAGARVLLAFRDHTLAFRLLNPYTHLRGPAEAGRHGTPRLSYAESTRTARPARRRRR